MNDKTIKINHSYITTLTSEQTRMAESCYATKSTITLDWWPHFCYTMQCLSENKAHRPCDQRWVNALSCYTNLTIHPTCL